MKLMLIIINNEDVVEVTKALLKSKYFVTKLSTTGGVINSGNTTLLLGVEDNHVARVKEIVANYSKTRKKKVTSANISAETCGSKDPQIIYSKCREYSDKAM